jgi:hypothetical protein
MQQKKKEKVNRPLFLFLTLGSPMLVRADTTTNGPEQKSLRSVRLHYDICAAAPPVVRSHQDHQYLLHISMYRTRPTSPVLTHSRLFTRSYNNIIPVKNNQGANWSEKERQYIKGEGLDPPLHLRKASK